MNTASSSPDQTAPAPEGFRNGLAELFQFGLRVARMVAEMADSEAALAQAAAQAGVAEGVSPMANSLAEAIESDRAAAAAAEARQTVTARVEAIAGAFALVSRAMRLTVLLAERMDRGWARGGAADDRRAMKRRQIARGVADAIGREADSERAERLTEALGERLERLDAETGIGDRPAQEIVDAICRDLGLDPVRMIVHPPLRDTAGMTEGDKAAAFAPAARPGGWSGCEAPPPQRQPDG